MKLGVIITTYNSPVWLEKVLWGYEHQSYDDFELIIADDGSGIETKQLIESFLKRQTLKISHVWHEDNNNQKPAIMNKAIAKAKYDYIFKTTILSFYMGNPLSIE